MNTSTACWWLAEYAAKQSAGALTGGDIQQILEQFQIETRDCDDPAYWWLLGDVWQVLNSTWLKRKLILGLFQSTRASRDRLMNADEAAAFEKLPQVITVYRGFCRRRAMGISWTTNKKVAETFALKFSKQTVLCPRVIVGSINKSDVLAYFTRRGEFEVVADPQSIVLHR